MNCDRVITLPCSLYGFCDASTAAYAAVMYLVVETSSHRSSSFVAAKTRVAPLAQLTIPRLELLSALLLARLITTVSKSLSTRVELMEPNCFTDSKLHISGSRALVEIGDHLFRTE